MEIDGNKKTLNINSIVYSYNERQVLKDCSLKIAKGHIYAFLGKNGSGKSTLIKIISGLLPLQKGTLHLGNIDIHRLSAKERAMIIGYVPQTYDSFFNFSVKEMVVMGRNPYMSVWNRPQKEDYQIAYEALKEIGVENLQGRYFGELSGGEKQLVLISRAIAQNSEFLLLDEPTSHLDFYYQHKVMEVLTKIVKTRNTGILIAMHDPHLTGRFAQYVCTLKDGQIGYLGKTDEVMTSEILSDLYDLDICVQEMGGHKNVFCTY
ncbi:MAG: ABC transporter ATP-binding protein [Eubacteriales bacterium]